MSNTIVGIGSLLSIESASSSFEPQNFRLAHIPGWERIFNVANVTCVPQGGDLATGEIAMLAARPITCEKRRANALPMAVSVFELDEEQTRNYYKREYGYNFTQVEILEADGTTRTGQIPAQNTETGFLKLRPDLAPVLEDMKKKWPCIFYYWEAPDCAPADLPTLLPPRYYLKICRTGSVELGCEDNFFDTTFLHDGRTVREYFAGAPDIEQETRAMWKPKVSEPAPN
ncbi:hypothetical protein DIPPA_58554 [Diplonema papillatum]|nr:hypothetical protein DIPPA_58554 [Diplonema papillatum]